MSSRPWVYDWFAPDSQAATLSRPWGITLPRHKIIHIVAVGMTISKRRRGLAAIGKPVPGGCWPIAPGSSAMPGGDGLVFISIINRVGQRMTSLTKRLIPMGCSATSEVPAVSAHLQFDVIIVVIIFKGNGGACNLTAID